MNAFKNEFLLNLAGREILLRPTFQNMANMESKLGSVASLAWLMMKPEKLLPLTVIAQIIYFNQAAHDKDEGQKPLSLEEIWELCTKSGIVSLIEPMIKFLGNMTTGNKEAPVISDALKKS